MNFTPGIRNNLKFDIPAGLVVFLVALPLCLGIALASDAPLLAGLIAGVVGGLIISPLSGSQLSVSGPAAGLAVIVAGYTHSLGSYEAFLAAGLIAGFIQIAFSLIGAGAIGGVFPSSVIKGMLASIGIIIVLKQIPHALGRDADFEGDLGFWQIGGENTFTEIIRAIYSASAGAIAISLASMALLILWERKWIKAQVWSKWVPGPLVAVIVGTFINEAFLIWSPSLAVIAQDGHLVSLPVDSSALLAQLRFPDFSALAGSKIWLAAVTIAIVGSIETLLNIEATEKLDPFRRIASRNRELLAQGVGNIISCGVGGLPITSVVVRSSASIYAGARTRMSGFIHGAFLALAVVAFPRVLNHVPLACLAAVLILVGYKLAKIDLFSSMFRHGWSQFLPFIATVTAVVLTDLLKGVMIGLVVGIFMVLRSNFYSAIVVIHEGRNYLVRFTKDVSFINRIFLKKELALLPPGSHVIVDGTRAAFIDHDIYDALDDFKETARYQNIDVEFKNIEGKQYPSFVVAGLGKSGRRS